VGERELGDQGVVEFCEVAGGVSEEGVAEDPEAHEDDDEDEDKLHAPRLWSMVYGLWSMAYGLWHVRMMMKMKTNCTPLVYGLWSMVYGLWSMVYGLWSMAYGTCG
jgi:hypothetical protein